jgi:predicted nucleotidyltransferase
MGTNQIQKSLTVFLRRVQKKYHPQQVILFGSYARGKARRGSDVDILVVSNSFKNTRDYDRFRELYILSNDLEPEFHVFGFTTEEIRSSDKTTTLKQALTQGVRIA